MALVRTLGASGYRFLQGPFQFHCLPCHLFKLVCGLPSESPFVPLTGCLLRANTRSYGLNELQSGGGSWKPRLYVQWLRLSSPLSLSAPETLGQNLPFSQPSHLAYFRDSVVHFLGIGWFGFYLALGIRTPWGSEHQSSHLHDKHSAH